MTTDSNNKNYAYFSEGLTRLLGAIALESFKK